MKKNYSELGRHFRELRLEKDLTLHKLSKEVDIDSPLLSKIERGERFPTLAQLQRLCKFFNVVEEDLKVLYTAEKIIKEFGINDTTYDAIRLIEEQIIPHITKRKLT